MRTASVRGAYLKLSSLARSGSELVCYVGCYSILDLVQVDVVWWIGGLVDRW